MLRVGRDVVHLPRHDGSHGHDREVPTSSAEAEASSSSAGFAFATSPLPGRSTTQTPTPVEVDRRRRTASAGSARRRTHHRRSCRRRALSPAAVGPATRSTAARLDRTADPRRSSIACAPRASARRPRASRPWPMRPTRPSPTARRRPRRSPTAAHDEAAAAVTRVGRTNLPPSDRGGLRGKRLCEMAGPEGLRSHGRPPYRTLNPHCNLESERPFGGELRRSPRSAVSAFATVALGEQSRRAVSSTHPTRVSAIVITTFARLVVAARAASAARGTGCRSRPGRDRATRGRRLDGGARSSGT